MAAQLHWQAPVQHTHKCQTAAQGWEKDLSGPNVGESVVGVKTVPAVHHIWEVLEHSL